MGVKNIIRQLASLIVIILVLLTISGVYAEDIDVYSSDVTESPLSVDVDVCLSSCNALNNDLSNIYEPSDSSNLYELSYSYGYYGSSDMPQIIEKIGNTQNSLVGANVQVLGKDLELHGSVEKNDTNTLMAEFTGNVKTSDCNKLMGDITREDNLVKFGNDDAILAISVSNMPNGIESVFDNTLKESKYISKVEEVYFGLLSAKDNDKLLNAAGSAKTLLFASMANWYNGTLKNEIIQQIVNHEQSYEGFFDVNTITKTLLKYDSQEKEWWIYKFSNEDEQSHVINDTNSHGLDYAYNHENVINKDMLKFVILSPYGIVFIEEQSSVGIWDGLDDILDGISSKTLLPDHQALWTPLLLLIQQDSQESSEDSHADDSKNKNKINDDENDISNSNSNLNGANHYGYLGGGHYSLYYATASVVPESGLDNLDNSTKNSNETNSTNITANSNKKVIESPKIDQQAEPTYTLVYAIIGIVLIGILFNSSYLRRDD